MKIKLLLSIIMLCLTTLYGLSGVVELEKQMDQVRIVTPNDTCGANTALARPILNQECGCCGANLFASASVLYWHPKVVGTEFSYISKNYKPDRGLPIKGCLKSIDFCWNWGLKAGLGYNFAHDGWDIFLGYTWFSARGCQLVRTGMSDAIVPLRSFPIDDQQFEKGAKSHFQICINALNLELGRAFYLSEFLALHPKIGLKAAWIGLGQLTRYTTFEGNVLISRDCNRFGGAGPRFGLGTQWHFCSGFYIFGDIAWSLMYGKFDVHHKDRYSFDPCNSFVRFCDMRHAFVPTIDTQLGLAYNTYCNCDSIHLRLRLGFDAQYLWRINQMIEIKEVANARIGRISEDASIHGVTFDMRLDF